MEIFVWFRSQTNIAWQFSLWFWLEKLLMEIPMKSTERMLFRSNERKLSRKSIDDIISWRRTFQEESTPQWQSRKCDFLFNFIEINKQKSLNRNGHQSVLMAGCVSVDRMFVSQSVSECVGVYVTYAWNGMCMAASKAPLYFRKPIIPIRRISKR